MAVAMLLGVIPIESDCASAAVRAQAQRSKGRFTLVQAQFVHGTAFAGSLGRPGLDQHDRYALNCPKVVHFAWPPRLWKKGGLR